MNVMRNTFRASVLLAALLAPHLLSGGEPVPAVNAKGGVAVRGYDVVAYFTQSRAVRGDERYEFQWMDATWRFASQEDRVAFASEPGKYAPQFGGYCAWAVGHNYTADADPEAWRIVDGKLYLNYNRSVQTKWEQDRAKWIEDGLRNWPALHR